MMKPTVLYEHIRPIEIGKSAFVLALNHPARVDGKPKHAHTSHVLKYDEITGEFETRNTIYKLHVEIKSKPKTDHAQTLNDLQPDQWTRNVPLTDKALENMSDNVKHFLSDNLSEFLYVTCDTCDIKSTCTCAFDPYNTDGDCLRK